VSFLDAAVARAHAAGINRAAIVLDPGIGFGKRTEDNLALLHGIACLNSLGYPVLIGVSRKRIIGDITGQNVEGRLAGSLGAAIAAWLNGAHIVRVHDVRQTIDAFKAFLEVRA